MTKLIKFDTNDKLTELYFQFRCYHILNYLNSELSVILFSLFRRII